MTGFADAFDGKAPAAVTRKRCTFCGLDNYLNTTMHPCCYFADAAGYKECAGCMAFEAREKRAAKRNR